MHCRNLVSISIGNGVTSIGSTAFSGCSALESVQTDNEYVKEWFRENLPNVKIVSSPNQILSLVAGWNWVAFNVLPQSHKVGDVLGVAGFAANDIIQTNGGIARFNGSGWLPSSFTVEYGKMYQIYVSCDTTVEISGDTSELSSMAIVTGWNWITNPTAKSVSPSELIHSGGWTAGDRIQSTNGIVTYTGSKWLPATGFTLEPGKGYQIYSTKVGTLSFPQ